MKILVIHGPNLNLLGTRAPEVYGTQTLDEVNAAIAAQAAKADCTVTFFQSNHEGDIIDRIHELLAPTSANRHDALVINPGAYTHYSIAIRDAIEAVGVPAIEVHLSDIAAREEFRRTSVIAPVCTTQISGKGLGSYLEAVDRLVGGSG
jgi:3-dehydroquinate dehydratase-2